MREPPLGADGFLCGRLRSKRKAQVSHGLRKHGRHKAAIVVWLCREPRQAQWDRCHNRIRMGERKSL